MGITADRPPQTNAHFFWYHGSPPTGTSAIPHLDTTAEKRYGVSTSTRPRGMVLVLVLDVWVPQQNLDMVLV